MRTMRLSLVGTVILALLGGLGGAALAQSDPPGRSMRSDILPGVELAVEEVEPGAYLVQDDGVRDLARANDLDIVAGGDGSVWLLRPDWFFRLGTQGAHRWPTQGSSRGRFEVAPDGTVWVQSGDALQSLGGEGWSVHDGHRVWETLAVASDGTVWSTWGEPERQRPVLGYFDDDGWQVVGDSVTDGELASLHVAGPEDIWGTVPTMVFPYVVRFVDGAWQRLDVVAVAESTRQQTGDLAPDEAEQLLDPSLGPDGTLWAWLWGVDKDDEDVGVDLVRFHGSEWSRWPSGDIGFTPMSPIEVAPDGSAWLGSGSECQGVGHFDGETWHRHLAGHCVRAIDIATGGAAWLLAKQPGADRFEAYVITPEADG